MNSKNYVPLHNHSHYSTLDGFATIEEYIKICKEFGFPGFGLADHGTASGLYRFITKMQGAGLIPVPGVEFYVAPENPKGAKAKEQIFYGQNGKAPKYDVSKGAYTHLTVFAYNNKGLENLFKLSSLSYLKEHFYHEPRIDTNMLAEHSEGLIVTTGCPSSEVSRRFLLGQDDKAYEYASRMKSIFGDNYYVEIMNHKMVNEELENILVPKQIKLARDLDIKIIATNDSHYGCKKDALAHEHFLAMSTDAKMSQLPKNSGGTRFTFSGPEYHVKGYEEMLTLFPADVAEEALLNTLEVMEKCKDIKLEYNAHLRPVLEVPEGETAISYFQKLIYEGFEKKRGHQPRAIQEESVKRIQEEFKVLHSNDFIDYFLVVNDYIDYAHKNNIGVGAGRGSVGGSEIAYVLDISNTDPIRFDLLFERFLSPGRGSLYQIDYISGKSEEIAVSDKKRVYLDANTSKIVYVHEIKNGDVVNFEGGTDTVKNIFVKVPGSAPDVDTDFHTKRREDVVQYAIEKYGAANVANIITFGTFKAKKGFKALCTLYEIPFAVANKISSLIPGMQGAEPSLGELFDETSNFYKEAADFRNAINADERLKKIIEIGMQLEGRISETGVHPCGVIMSNTPLSGVIPTMVRQKDGKIITQWEYPELEALGLIKMDLLGLELIDTIYQTIENIKLANISASNEKYVREVPDIRELIAGEMDDEESYKTLQEGNTVGIFQLGSPGVRELLKMSKPSTFMEIANITALYRPGPMKSGAHIQYANRKNGDEEISYIHQDFHGTEVEEILKETFGLMIFQEQIMLIAGRYAGFTPYETDKLRKAVGKKKMDVMMKMKKKFVEGCTKRGASEEASEILWETIRVFGEYGFNKSHSVSYALNIYQALYLKTHYPKEFMAAVIQQGFGTADKVRSYIQEAKRMKLKIGPVDINSSQVQMASTGIDPNNKYDIIFGFSGIKQMNDNIAAEIVAERVANGPYKSVANFVERIVKRTPISTAALGNLALAGAFDCFGVSRKLVKEKAKALIDSSSKKAAKGVSLFDMMGGGASAGNVTESIQITGEDFTYIEKIKAEAEVIGMFISGHPTSNLGHISKMFKATTFEKIKNGDSKARTFNVLGTITDMKSKLNKAGNRSIAVLLDDGISAEGTFLPKALVQSIEKGEEFARIRIAKEKGEQYSTPERLKAIMLDQEISPVEPLELNEAYLFTVGKRGYGETAQIVVNQIQKLKTAPDGSLPYEIKIPSDSKIKEVEAIVNKYKSKNGFYVQAFINDEPKFFKSRVNLNLDFIMEMEKTIGRENIITKGI